jgi:hypothetical protein
MIGLDQVWGIDLVGQFPSVIIIGIAYPLDQVLQLF